MTTWTFRTMLLYFSCLFTVSNLQSRTRSFSTFSRVISDNAKKVLQFTNVNISSDFARGSVEYCFIENLQYKHKPLIAAAELSKYILLWLCTFIGLSFSRSNNQPESLDYQNKVSDFNHQRSGHRNNRSSESSEREHKKASSEFYLYQHPDNSVERVELRPKPGLYSDRRVEELRDSPAPAPGLRPSPEGAHPRPRSRLSSPLLQRRQPGQASPALQRRSVEVAVPQVPQQVPQQVAGVFSSNSLQRPRRVSSGSGTRRPGSSEVRASATNNSCFLYSLIHDIRVIISLLLPRLQSLVTTPPRSPGAVSPWTRAPPPRPCCSDTATSPRTPATTTTTTTAWAQGPHSGPPPLCWPAWTSRYFRSGAYPFNSTC